jgi:hypothetical protein
MQQHTSYTIIPHQNRPPSPYSPSRVSPENSPPHIPQYSALAPPPNMMMQIPPPNMMHMNPPPYLPPMTSAPPPMMTSMGVPPPTVMISPSVPPPQVNIQQPPPLMSFPPPQQQVMGQPPPPLSMMSIPPPNLNAPPPGLAPQYPPPLVPQHSQQVTVTTVTVSVSSGVPILQQQPPVMAAYPKMAIDNVMPKGENDVDNVFFFSFLQQWPTILFEKYFSTFFAY